MLHENFCLLSYFTYFLCPFYFPTRCHSYIISPLTKVLICNRHDMNSRPCGIDFYPPNNCNKSFRVLHYFTLILQANIFVLTKTCDKQHSDRADKCWNFYPLCTPMYKLAGEFPAMQWHTHMWKSSFPGPPRPSSSKTKRDDFT